ncbi:MULTISPECIES: hypothetical protein [Yersinia]|uniref:hypothetical protein n=1 Tax=Yersinia TaxID=629 RepID=UPI0005DE3BA8|nr:MULTISPECIES: hypothetical protein [Yersinia]MDA5498016.1 hypothetical protein [Yersinia aleksiciae]NIL00983.1 phage tail protein [Yersinia aleksiciae]WQC71633.1 hypothetical protein N0K21_03970 [Yersinia aleksiciae]CNE76414.1 tail fiber protein [Yersinia mollaretii]
MSKLRVNTLGTPDDAFSVDIKDIASVTNAPGVIGSVRNAKMSIPAVSSTATYTADELIVQTAIGGRQYKLTGFNKSINLSNSGVGGMDTGNVPTAGYVAIYAIYNPTSSVSALLAVNASSVMAPEAYGGVNMPAGYEASALVSVWGIAASKFVVGYQSGRHISIISTQFYNTTGYELSYAAASLVTLVPPNGKKANVQISASQITPNSAIQFNLASTPQGVGSIFANVSTVTGGGVSTVSNTGGYGELDITGAQTLYFKMANTVAGTYSITCGGYTI